MLQVLSLVLRRVLTIIPILLATTLFVFILLEFAPGDPAATSQGQAVSQEHRERFYEQHGLDDPLPLRYLRFLGNVLSGEFGYALVSGAPIAKLIANSVPVTIQLTALGLGFAAAIAFLGGILGAIYRDRWPDVVVRFGSIAMVAAPNFWLGLLMINWFAVELSWLPAGGYEPLAKGFGPWISSLIMPAVALGLPVAGILTRVVRASVVEELEKDYVRTALGAGLPRSVVIGRNVLRNALVSPLTVLGLWIGYLLAGAVLVETVFAIPGVGRLLVDGVLDGDLFLIRSIALVTVTLFLLANLLVDISYILLNPRIREA